VSYWTPVIGDWNGDGKTKVGVTNGLQWYLDYDGNGVWNATVDKSYNFGVIGYAPVIGDWNGDGKSKIGVYKDGTWYLDYLGEGVATSNTKVYNFGASGDTPVVGKWS